MKVPVGPTTVAGYSVTAVAFAAAVTAYLTGDHSQQTLGTILAGVLGGLAFLSTQAGRFVQAHHLAKAVASPLITLEPADIDDPALDDPNHQTTATGVESLAEHVALSDEPRPPVPPPAAP
jgi:hypothetical protein